MLRRRAPGPAPADSSARAGRRRDRHGRGMRGPLAVRSQLTPHGAPLSRTRAQRFDDVVLDAVERVERRLPEQLDKVEFAVEDVPGAAAPSTADGVPLAATLPGVDDVPARIVVFRRPIELRTTGITELELLVRDVVTEQVADLVGMPPEDIDPEYGVY